MKKIFILFFVLFVAFKSEAQTTYTWTNLDGDFDYENPNNWTPDPLNEGILYPTFLCFVQLDGLVSQDNLPINADYGVTSIVLKANYTGTVDASGSDYITVQGISLLGGTFLAPYVQLETSGNLIKTGGNFVKNPTGIVRFNLNSTGTRNLSGNFDFNILDLNASGTLGSRFINLGTGTSTCQVLSLNGGVFPMAYRGSINVTEQLSILGTTATAATNNTGTVIFTGAGTKTISGTASPLQNPIGNIRINTSADITMSGNITVAQSWSVANTGNLLAGTSTVNMTGTATTIFAGTTSSTRANFDNLTITTGSTTSINGSSQINITGALTNNGTLNTNTSLIRLTGTGAQSIAGTASLTSINALEVTNTGVKTIATPVTILDSVKVSAAGTLAAAGQLRLRSNNSMKARIAAIAPGGDVSGNVIVETYLPGGTTGWANLCSPGLSGQTMSNWNTSIPITCSGCPYTEVGGVPFESVYSYNETLGAGTASAAAHYIPISSLGDAINPGLGYWVYLGDGLPGTGDITPVLTGPINKNNSFGGMALTLTGGVSSENGWNLISNPYPSPISLSKMFAGNAGNIDNTIQIWNADLNGGNGDWAFYVLGGATDAVPMGQGIMVRALNALNLTGNENWKTTSNVSVQRSANNGFDYKDLFKLNLKGGGANNFDTYAYFDFQHHYSLGFDNGRDVYSIDNASGNTVAQIYSKVNSDKYASAAFPMPSMNGYSIIPIHVPTGYSGVYTITPFNNNALPGLCMQLIDLSNNNVHDLFNGAYTTTINANDGTSPLFNLKVIDCGAFVGGEPTTINSLQAEDNSVVIYKDASGVFVKLNFDQSKETTISVTNILGQKILEDAKVNAYKETLTLDIPEKNQVIFVTVTTDKERVTKKIIR